MLTDDPNATMGAEQAGCGSAQLTTPADYRILVSSAFYRRWTRLGGWKICQASDSAC